MSIVRTRDDDRLLELSADGGTPTSSPLYRSAFNRDRLVHIVDSDTATVEALSTLFRLEGFQTVFSTDAPHFLAAVARRRIDVAVINLEVREDSGLPLLRHVKSTMSGVPTFMLCNRPQIESAVTAMKLGANDVLSKPIDSEYLLGVVRDSLRRDIHLGAMHKGARSFEIRGFGQLTNRERDVLQLVTNGQSNKEAGRELGISPRTVEVHRARVMDKLGARNTADLIRIVLTQ